MPCQLSLEEVEKKITTCKICPRLVAWREKVGEVKRRAFLDQTYWARPVPGFGDPAARVLVVGLAPGAHGSNRTGRMFTGDASGDFLYPALNRAGLASQPFATAMDDGLTLNKIFITAVCRCVPPENKPLPVEIANCLGYLSSEMALLPRLEGIVALGKIAFDTIAKLVNISGDNKVPVCFGHGVLVQPNENAPWLIGSYHPSRQNTQTGRLTALMFDQIWEEVVKLLG